MSVQTVAAPDSHPTPSGKIALWVLVAMFAIGVASLVHGLSGDTIRPDFRLLTVSYLYLMGISQAGVVFCAMMRLMRARWARPYYRLAELSTLAFLPFAIGMFLLLYFCAREQLFFWLADTSAEHSSPWLSSRWLLIRNLFGLLLFYGVSVVYVVKSFEPDPGVSERQLFLLSPWVLVAFVICNTFIAWDLGMMLLPHWHSTVFPIYFWFGNLFAGTAALLVFPALASRSRSGGSPFGPEQIRSLGMLLTAFTLLWLYFFWAQFFVIWFGNVPREFTPLWRQMYGHYAPYYWSMMIGCFFVPFAAFIFAIVKRSLLVLGLIALGINVGIWINKYLTVVAALVPDDRPFDTWMDLALALGLLAGFAATLLVLAGRVPGDAIRQ